MAAVSDSGNRTEVVVCPARKMPPIINKIVCGDNCAVMCRLPDECVDLVVTSPPYDNIRAYEGHGWDFYGTAWQLQRVLRPGGIIVWIVADATVDGSETGSSMRQALHFKELGLWLHDTMIYGKINPQPINKNRYEHAWEYMFVLSKGKPTTHNIIQKRSKCVGRLRSGTMRNHGSDELKEKQLKGFTNTTSSLSNIWMYVVGGGKTQHPAVFPEQLAADHIQSWSNKGDLVLDPFCGSGTTPKVACLLERRFIGIEISPDYCAMAVERVGKKGFFV